MMFLPFKSLEFEWDPEKSKINQEKHGILLEDGISAFHDPKRIIEQDMQHSAGEPRYFCYGVVAGRIMTVRFTFRNDRVRIIGAAFWRKGRKIYESLR